MKNCIEDFRKVKIDTDNGIIRVSKFKDHMQNILLAGKTWTRFKVSTPFFLS